MSLITRVYDYMLQHPKTKRGSWGGWYFRERYVKVLEEIMRDRKTLMRVLDVGCGKGLYAYYLHQKKSSCIYIGCDLSKNSLKTAYKDNNTNYVLCDAHALPLRTRSIEVVLCSEVLEHVSSPDQVLNSMCDVSRKAIVITFPDEPLQRILGVRHPEHVSTINWSNISTTLESNGYELLKIGKILSFSIPCGMLEFLRIPRNKGTKSFVRLIDIILKTLLPSMFIPYTVVLVVAAKIDPKVYNTSAR